MLTHTPIMFLHTFHPQPILAHLGPLTIHWYGLFLSLAALAGYVVFQWIGRRYGFKPSQLEVLFFWTILFGIIGARLYHVSNEWSYYAAHLKEILSVWNGGLAIHGGLVAGLLVFAFYARRTKRSFWLLADIAAPAVALGQAIGRWGNYFNQELFGKPTNLPWGIPIDTLNRPIEYSSFSYFHPTFLYESLGSLIVFLLLLALHRTRLRRSVNAPSVTTQHQPSKESHMKFIATGGAGFIILVYFILESLLRHGTELLRVDRVPVVFGVRLPLLVSLAIAVASAIALLIKFKRQKTA